MSNRSEDMRALLDQIAGPKLGQRAESMRVNDLKEATSRFSSWGKVDEAWGGEPSSEPNEVNVWQDTNGYGATYDWHWTRAVNGHIVASGSAKTEEEAREAASA